MVPQVGEIGLLFWGINSYSFQPRSMKLCTHIEIVHLPLWKCLREFFPFSDLGTQSFSIQLQQNYQLSMCQCGKMLRQAQQLWLHMLRLYHVTSAVALVDLQVWYNATSDVALVDLLRCYHVTSDVALVDLLLWYYVMSGVALVDILLWYHVINNVVPEWLNVQLTDISLSPKRCGCGPGFVNCQIKVITKLPNSEQSYKAKVKTHNYINRQNQSTTGKL